MNKDIVDFLSVYGYDWEEGEEQIDILQDLQESFWEAWDTESNIYDAIEEEKEKRGLK